jgi:hypothetical protein
MKCFIEKAKIAKKCFIRNTSYYDLPELRHLRQIELTIWLKHQLTQHDYQIGFCVKPIRKFTKKTCPD